MNFHTDCPKGLLYTGDVNIEHGGVFIDFREESEKLAKAIEDGTEYREWLNYWEVAEFSMMDNQWQLDAGEFLVAYDPKEEAKYHETHGKLPDSYTLAAEAWAIWRWHETYGKDVYQSQLIQIGHDLTYASSNYRIPDHVYHAHKKLHNVALAWVKEV